MKYIISVILCFAVMPVFTSCTDGNSGEDYVYYFSADLDSESGGVILYAVMKKNVKKKDSEAVMPVCEVFTASDVESAFGAFFDNFGDVYTGTVKEYSVSASLGEKGENDFKIYLANSPRLPVKKKTLTIGNAAAYIEEKLAELTE